MSIDLMINRYKRLDDSVTVPVSTILSVMACPGLVCSLRRCVRWRESKWKEKWTYSRPSMP